MNSYTRKTWLGLAGWLLLCFAAAFLGAIVSPGWASPAWYDNLLKPVWTPPKFLFGPVWTTLYTLMAIAAWLIWRRHGFGGAPRALWLFVVQLVLNAAWSWIFFGAHALGWASFEIVVLWGAIVATIAAFSRHSKPAAWLMVPYILWVSYAAALTFAVWQMNPG